MTVYSAAVRAEYTAMIARLSVAAAAARVRYESRYPLADATLPLPERMAADERTLAALIRERAARQFLSK